MASVASSGCIRALLVICILLFWHTRAIAWDTLQCHDHIVGVGDTTTDIRAACGQPSYLIDWSRRLPLPLRYSAETAIWFYNFGPSRLLWILKFRGRHVNEINSDGYGFADHASTPCQPDDLRVGMSEYRLFARCGPPVKKRSTLFFGPSNPQGFIQQRADGVYVYSGGYNRPVYRERWIYRFGDHRPLSEVTLDNGRVTDVKTIDGPLDQNQHDEP